MQTPDFDFEKSLLPFGTRFLLGVDEVGRGPLAGPVALGAFLLDLDTFNPETFVKTKVRDSKTLSEKQRCFALSYFKQNNYSYKVFFAYASLIDKIGISSAIALTVKKIVSTFPQKFDFVLLDGSLSLPSDIPHRSIIKADTKCFSVASASIVAKVTRDHHMCQLDQTYPGYGFSVHKGYGTAAHFQALQTLGPCPIHRQSYKPIKNFTSPSP
ncbi:ribonuclease HII [Patescibacteria group bacterium]|nr:ribonuclease HII [Patescibacteria group bacterium]